MTGVTGTFNCPLPATAVGVMGEMSMDDVGEIGSTGDIMVVELIAVSERAYTDNDQAIAKDKRLTRICGVGTTDRKVKHILSLSEAQSW